MCSRKLDHREPREPGCQGSPVSRSRGERVKCCITSVKVSIALITAFDRLLRWDILKDDFPLASDMNRMA